MRKNLTFKFVPYESIKDNPSKAIVNLVRKGNVVVIDTKLKAEDEAKIIQDTMKIISEDFKGIEISSLDFEKETGFARKLKEFVSEKFFGKKPGFTVIGPSSIIKNIKKHKTDVLFEFV